MARPITQIYGEMTAEKDSQASLASLAPDQDTAQELIIALRSTSKVAIWRLIFYSLAVAIHVHEVLWDLFREEVEAMIRAAPPGTVAWYQQLALAWQFGDQLAYADYRYAYPEDDAAKRIVRRASVQERPGGVLLFKVAKLDGQGDPIPLEEAETVAFVAYLRKVRFAGTEVAVVSQPADALEVRGSVYFDGEVPLAEVRAAVDAAVEEYLAQLPWNGELSKIRLIDAIQGAKGVTDVSIAVLFATRHTQGSQTIGREYIPAAGYFSLPVKFSETLTFLPEN